MEVGYTSCSLFSWVRSISIVIHYQGSFVNNWLPESQDFPYIYIFSRRNGGKLAHWTLLRPWLHVLHISSLIGHKPSLLFSHITPSTCLSDHLWSSFMMYVASFSCQILLMKSLLRYSGTSHRLTCFTCPECRFASEYSSWSRIRQLINYSRML